MFRGSEMPRRLSMFALLAVLAVLMVRAADPNSWRWLCDDDKCAATPVAKSAPARAAKPASEEKAPAEGPTDEDPEQRTEAAEEFEAVTDGTLGIQSEEAFAYWRLLLWTERQSPEGLDKRAQHSPTFAELMQFPNKYRARLIRLTLNVRRVLAYDLEEENPLGLKRLYEIWGFTDDSKAWLYCVVTAHLPPGMAVGSAVEERGRFVGYFLKLQGYHEAGAKPHTPALRAPLLVGRVTRYTAAPVRVARTGMSAWEWSLVAGLAALGVFVVAAIVVANRRAVSRQAAREVQTRESVRDWLQGGFSPDSAAGSGDDHPDDGPMLQPTGGNGRPRDDV